MTRKQLLGIKSRVEGTLGVAAAARPGLASAGPANPC
jgi:hypothetical protein